MARPVSTATAKLTCLCGAISEPGNLLTADVFPAEAALCNCNTCRYCTGGLGCTTVELNSAPSPQALATCSAYTSSGRRVRYFCHTCGTKTFISVSPSSSVEDSGTGYQWFALSGIIDRSDQSRDIDTVKLARISCIADTKDGGLVRRMQAVGRKGLENVPCWDDAPSTIADSFTMGRRVWPRSNPNLERTSGHVVASCHCGQVQLHITALDTTARSEKQLQRWTRQNRAKWAARFCTCRSCRLSFGLPLVAWTYQFPENILTAKGESINFADFHNDVWQSLPGLQSYRSRQDVRRSFCRTCGATVFFENINRPEAIDIGLGLFKAPSGALAEEWVEWSWSRVSFHQECRDQHLLLSLSGDLQD